MTHRFVGPVGKAFRGNREQALLLMGSARLLAQQALDRIAARGGSGVQVARRTLGDGSTVEAWVSQQAGQNPLVRVKIWCPEGEVEYFPRLASVGAYGVYGVEDPRYIETTRFVETFKSDHLSLVDWVGRFKRQPYAINIGGYYVWAGPIKLGLHSYQIGGKHAICRLDNSDYMLTIDYSVPNRVVRVYAAPIPSEVFTAGFDDFSPALKIAEATIPDNFIPHIEGTEIDMTMRYGLIINASGTECALFSTYASEYYTILKVTLPIEYPEVDGEGKPVVVQLATQLSDVSPVAGGTYSRSTPYVLTGTVPPITPYYAVTHKYEGPVVPPEPTEPLPYTDTEEGFASATATHSYEACLWAYYDDDVLKTQKLRYDIQATEESTYSRIKTGITGYRPEGGYYTPPRLLHEDYVRDGTLNIAGVLTDMYGSQVTLTTYNCTNHYETHAGLENELPDTHVINAVSTFRSHNIFAPITHDSRVMVQAGATRTVTMSSIDGTVQEVEESITDESVRDYQGRLLINGLRNTRLEELDAADGILDDYSDANVLSHLVTTSQNCYKASMRVGSTNSVTWPDWIKAKVPTAAMPPDAFFYGNDLWVNGKIIYTDPRGSWTVTNSMR